MIIHGYRNLFGEERLETALFTLGTGNVIKAIVTDWFFGTESGGPTYYGILKRWTGAAWIKEPLRRWTGAAWVAAVLKRWDGAAWKLVDTTGV